jgi:vacuolar-type H+-ATPase subunit H
VSARRRSETLATSASEQVRAIVEAAEASAAQIQSDAEAEAHEIRTEATTEANAARNEATSQARTYVSRVSESTAVMMQRLDAMQSELGTLISALRTGGNRLNADLQLLDTNFDEVRGAILTRGRFDDAAEDESEPVPAAVAAQTELTVVTAEFVEAEVVSVGDTNGEADELDSDVEGARLIALNMALNGTSRDETDRYLAENFRLSDRTRLLDEVYASVEG